MDLKELENEVSFAAIVLWRNYLTALKAHHGARWFWVTLIVIRRYVYATFYKLFCIPKNELITIIPPPNSFYSTKPFLTIMLQSPNSKVI